MRVDLLLDRANGLNKRASGRNLASEAISRVLNFGRATGHHLGQLTSELSGAVRRPLEQPVRQLALEYRAQALHELGAMPESLLAVQNSQGRKS